MNPEVVAAIISGVSLLGSWIISSLVSARKSGERDGRNDLRLSLLESNQDKLATKEQLGNVEKQLARIEGMFTMTLKQSDASN